MVDAVVEEESAVHEASEQEGNTHDWLRSAARSPSKRKPANTGVQLRHATQNRRADPNFDSLSPSPVALLSLRLIASSVLHSPVAFDQRSSARSAAAFLATGYWCGRARSSTPPAARARSA